MEQEKGGGIKKKKSNQAGNTEIYKIDIVELYKILFSNEAYFYSLLQNSNPSQNIKNIWKYTKENLEADSLYYDDAIAIAYLYLKYTEQINIKILSR